MTPFNEIEKQGSAFVDNNLPCIQGFKHVSGNTFEVKPRLGQTASMILTQMEVLAAWLNEDKQLAPFVACYPDILIKVTVNDITIAISSQRVDWKLSTTSVSDAILKRSDVWDDFWANISYQKKKFGQALEGESDDLELRASLISGHITRLKSLYERRASEDEMLEWLVKFAPISDYSLVKYDKEAVAQVFIDMFPDEVYLTDGQKNAGQPLDPADTGRWVIGQAIDMLLRGNGIHPQLASFAKTYLDQKQEPSK